MMINFNKLVGVALLLYLTGSNKVPHFNLMKDDVNIVKGEAIAKTAEKYRGSTDWAANKRKDNFPPGTKKCNKLVYDVLKEAGVTAPVYPRKKPGDVQWPLVAADWADSSCTITAWQHMGYGVPWKRGDVIAEKRNYSDATGHCGIAISSSQVVGEQANSVTTEGHDFGANAAVRRYTGR